MKKIKKLHEGIKEKWLNKDNINGVFYGKKIKDNKITDEICISFHVSEKLPLSEISKKNRIPKKIDGIKTDVVQAIIRPNTVVPYSGDVYKYTIRPGLSITPECMSKAGTLGILAYDLDDNGAVGILSNHHVLVDKYSSNNSYIKQPATGIACDDRIAELNFNKIYLGLRGDFAFATLLDYRPFNFSIYGTEISIISGRDPVIGETITKVGRTTGITQSEVISFGDWTSDYSGNYSDAWYGNVTISGFVSAPLSDPNETITAGGDSGSLWYSENTKEAVGIHTAGSTSPSYAYSSLITNALNDLNLSLSSDASNWRMDGGDVFAIINPKWISGNTSMKITLSFIPPFDMDNVFLFTDTDFIDCVEGGIVWAKRSSDSLYMSVGAQSIYPMCYIGNTKASIPVSIDVIVKNTNNLSLSGDYDIPIYIGQGSQIYVSGILTNDLIS